MTITLLSAKASPPDSDGDARFEASINFKNEDDVTIEMLHVRMLVADSNGIPLGEAEEDIRVYSTGESGRLSISLSNSVSRQKTDARLIITVVPMSRTFIDLGKLNIPNQPGGLSYCNEEFTSMAH